MVFDSVLFLVALVGSGIAAVYDWKTTEVPDWVFYAMFGIGLPVVLIKSFFASDVSPFFLSSVSGIFLAGFGLLMYKAGQWGGADALLLGIVGFLLPQAPNEMKAGLLFPFPLSFLFNLFIVGTAYMLVYSAAVAARNDKFKILFANDLKASARTISVLSASLFLVFALGTFYMQKIFSGAVNVAEIVSTSIIPLILTMSLMIVYKFAILMEKNIFRKRISVSKLRAGDVLLKRREIVGIDESELAKIRKSGGKYVWIKEGISFVPAFVLALLFTFFVGDAIAFLIPLRLLM